MADGAPFAAQCCPSFALRALTPDELRHLDAYCARALDDPEAEPAGDEETAAVARYERVLARLAVDVRKRERRGRYGRRPVAP